MAVSIDAGVVPAHRAGIYLERCLPGCNLDFLYCDIVRAVKNCRKHVKLNLIAVIKATSCGSVSLFYDVCSAT